jgi:hypothetical protein
MKYDSEWIVMYHPYLQNGFFPHATRLVHPISDGFELPLLIVAKPIDSCLGFRLHFLM